ncbi:hypothetical protein ABBQ38_011820 [Trebouxia sp. C0009 RCD-2024]
MKLDKLKEQLYYARESGSSSVMPDDMVQPVLVTCHVQDFFLQSDIVARLCNGDRCMLSMLLFAMVLMVGISTAQMTSEVFQKRCSMYVSFCCICYTLILVSSSGTRLVS